MEVDFQGLAQSRKQNYDDEYNQDFQPLQQSISQQKKEVTKYDKERLAIQYKQNEEKQRQIKNSPIKNTSQKGEQKSLRENKNVMDETTLDKKQDRESRIKDTINRITKNIIVSKQSIVQDISSINQFYQDNQKQINYQYKSRMKYHQTNSRVKQGSKDRYEDSQEHKMKIVQQLKKKMEDEVRLKQEERKRKRQIYEQQKQIRKQQQKLEKNQSKVKKDQLQKRIIYEQKFITRRAGSPEIPITQEQVMAFENAFIQHIKDRLNIGKYGKIKNKHKSLEKTPKYNRGKVKEEHKKNYNKKISKNEKLKQKIILNLRQKIQKQLQPTYESIVADSKQFENVGTPDRKRSHQSAPQFRLPDVSPKKPERRTFYSKQVTKPHKIHILKISQEIEKN